MVKYYGTSILKPDGYSKHVANFLTKDIKNNNRMIFIPADFEDVVEISYQIEKHLAYFSKIGIEFKEYVDITMYVGSENIKEIILNADVIILGGGNPFVQFEYLKKYGIDVLLGEYNGVLMGYSAGAMCMSKHIVMTPLNDEYPEFDIRDGMNLDGISIIPHFNINGSLIPDSITNEYGETMVIADLYQASKYVGLLYLLSDVPQATFIRCEKELIEVIDGDCYLIEQGEIAKYESNNY